MNQVRPLLLFPLLLAMAVAVAPGALAQTIVVDETGPGCVLTGNWADNKGNNRDRQFTSTAGLVGGTQHYTSRHPPYARTGRETAVWTPDLPGAGNYRVAVSWRCSENRSSKVTYEVRHAQGVHRTVINQRTGGGKKTLGVFPFAAGRSGSLALVADGGASASADAAFFTPTNDPVGPASGGGSDLDRIVGGGSGPRDDAPGGDASGGAPRLTGAGRRVFVAPADGTVKVTARLSTYGPATLTARIGAEGKEAVWMSWTRRDDRDGSPLQVDGSPVPGSIVESSPGDMSPKATTHARKVKKGERIVLVLDGAFGAGSPELALTFEK